MVPQVSGVPLRSLNERPQAWQPKPSIAERGARPSTCGHSMGIQCRSSPAFGTATLVAEAQSEF
jgi:hypothetical protein